MIEIPCNTAQKMKFNSTDEILNGELDILCSVSLLKNLLRISVSDITLGFTA